MDDQSILKILKKYIYQYDDEIILMKRIDDKEDRENIKSWLNNKPTIDHTCLDIQPSKTIYICSLQDNPRLITKKESVKIDTVIGSLKRYDPDNVKTFKLSEGDTIHIWNFDYPDRFYSNGECHRIYPVTLDFTPYMIPPTKKKINKEKEKNKK